jgi:GntR family transcriptional regulator
MSLPGSPPPARPKASPTADRVEEALREWLVRRRPRPGDRLPPDTELAQAMGVARGTLRTALHRLEEGGYIRRRQGSGTFVLRPLAEDASETGMELLESFEQMAVRQGRSLRVVEVGFDRREPAPPGPAHALGVAPGAPAPLVRRTVLIDGTPSLVMTDVVHPSVRLPRARELRRALGEGASMLDLIETAGVRVAYVTTSISARTVLPEEPVGRRLNLSEAVAMVELTEIAYRATGAAVKHSEHLMVPGSLDLRVVRSVAAETVGRPPAVAARTLGA